MNNEEFTIKIADVRIGIIPRNDNMYKFCKKYLCDGEPDFTVSASDKDIEEENERIIAFLGRGDTSEDELEKLFIYRQIAERMPEYGAFLMHATSVRVDEDAYLFTGPSGTGKTTHARLWKKHFGDRLRVINDDKPMVKIDGDRIMVCASPWCGKERWHNNINAPLKAVISLHQAEENKIRPMKRSEAWEHLMSQIYRSKDAVMMQKTLDFVDRIIAMMPIYRLECNRDEESVMVAYETASGNGKQKGM